jgi:CHASE2 domain-containing sensor protein
MNPAPGQKFVAAAGLAVTAMMVLMKIVPAIPGLFSAYEWLALGAWALIGAALGWRERKTLNTSGPEVTTSVSR